jgi:hypothetical protein
VSTFPSLQYVQELQDHCNNLQTFQEAAEWADLNLLIAFGDERYWLKLYRGKIIDVMEYLPMTNALGYTVIVHGGVDAWREVMDGQKSWALLSTGRILIEGDLMKANQMHEALCLIIESVADVTGEVSDVA